MKLQIVSDQGIVLDEFENVDDLNLYRSLGMWRILGFVRVGVREGKMLDQEKTNEKKRPQSPQD